MLKGLVLLFITLFGLYIVFGVVGNSRTETVTLLFLDVGQGDALVIKNGNLPPVVIDGGPSKEISSTFFVFPYLSVCKVSLMILTHPHADHLVGLNRLLQLCKVENLSFTNLDYSSRGYSEFKTLAAGPSEVQLYQGDVLKYGKVTFYVLWPPKRALEEGSFGDINNTSTVLLMDFGSFEALLTGDIDKRTQSMLNLGKYADIIDGKVDVYKVPHHGSLTSYDKGFLLSLQPEVAVVSVGENSYGHPNREFLDFFEQIGTRVFRTDHDGTVRIKIVEEIPQPQ